MKIPKIKTLGKEKLLLLGMAGIILIIVSYFDIGSNQKTTQNKQEETETQSHYIEKMEKKVQTLVSSFHGVSDVNVVITLKEGNEKVVKEDMESNHSKKEEKDANNTDSSTKKTTVVFSDDGNEVPYVVKEIYPQVQGIAVTAKGVSDTEIRNGIMNMLGTLFDIPIHKITVMEI